MNTPLGNHNLPAHSGGIRSEFHILVHSVSRLLGTLFDRSLSHLNITRAQWWALKVIAIPRETELNQTDLTQMLSSTKASVGKLLVKMESAGLVARHPDPMDQRAQYVRILEKGKTLLVQAALIEQHLGSSINNSISTSDLKIASQTLIHAKSNIYGRFKKSPSPIQTTHLIEKMESAAGQTDPNWVGYLVHDVARMRQSIMDRLLHPMNITRSQWWVLSFLIQRDGMTQSSLAKELELSRSALGTLILRLEENQLVIKLPDPEDSRRNRVLLTKAGASLVRSIRETTSQAEDFVLGGITEEDIHTTVDVMRSMKDNISKMLGDHAASFSHVDNSL